MRWSHLAAYPLAFIGASAVVPPETSPQEQPRPVQAQPQAPAVAPAPPTASARAEGNSKPVSIGIPASVRQYSVHYGAESAELRTLRIAEEKLFPELGQVSLIVGDPPGSARWGPPEEPRTQGTLGVREVPGGAQQRPSWLSKLALPGLPVSGSPRVARFVTYFTKDPEGRRIFETWLERSGTYTEIIREELVARGLPEDLRAVAFVESGLWATAESRAGALGLWQFMPHTAQAYGLVVDPRFDERRSIWKSTAAAARHLRDLHECLGTWDLALAAYNMGYVALLSRMQSGELYDYWSLADVEGALPRETVLYVPKVLAVAIILKNLRRFGFGHVEVAPSLQAGAVRVPPGVRLSLIARAAGTSVRRLRELNPEFLGAFTPDLGSPVTVHVPALGLSRARATLPKLLEQMDESPLDLNVTADFDWGEDDEDAELRLEATASPTTFFGAADSAAFPTSTAPSAAHTAVSPGATAPASGASEGTTQRPEWAARTPSADAPRPDAQLGSAERPLTPSSSGSSTAAASTQHPEPAPVRDASEPSAPEPNANGEVTVPPAASAGTAGQH